MGRDADRPDAAELEERQGEIVVPGVEIEAGGDDVTCGFERGLGLLDPVTFGISARAEIVAGSASTTTRLGMS